jgi:hypothetical protein
MFSTTSLHFTVLASACGSNAFYTCLLLGCGDSTFHMMLMAFVLREPSILRSSIFGYRRSVVDVAGSVIGYELCVAYFGVLDLGYATPKVIMAPRDACVAGCGN